MDACDHFRFKPFLKALLHPPCNSPLLDKLQGAMYCTLQCETHRMHQCKTQIKSACHPYLPFFIVFRPMRGSSTASIDSPIFSINTQSPFATARSMVSRNLKQRKIVLCKHACFAVSNATFILKNELSSAGLSPSRPQDGFRSLAPA